MRSDRWWRAAAVVVVAVSYGAPVHALDVFTCEPEWASLTKAFAPDATIVSATHARQDPHHIEARPSLIAALRRADLAVCTGASLEVGWLPMLQQRAGNAAVQTGRPGMFFVSDVVDLIDARPDADRSMGDVHAEGNPHVHLDPGRLATIGAALAQRLSSIDPSQAAAYQQRHQAWAAAWQLRTDAWRAKAAPLAGRKVVAQHGGFTYLWRWAGIEQIADLEPKPGLPPTPSHLQQLVETARSARPIAIVHSLYQDPQAARWLSTRTDLPVLALPGTVTDDGRSNTLEGLFDLLLEQLLGAADRRP